MIDLDQDEESMLETKVDEILAQIDEEEVLRKNPE